MDDIKTFSLSFKGRRENNEDSYIEIRPNSRAVFIAVADGMGGTAGGEKASRAVIECCRNIIEEKITTDKLPDLKQILRKIYFESQVTIRKIIKDHAELNGMGTTLACLLIFDNKFVWGNLGDSRIYRISDSGIKLITKDHTHIQDFMDEPDRHLSKSMIENYSNFLTRSIDGGNDEPDIFPETEDSLEIQKGECFFICSDGLITNKAETSPAEFYEIILGSKTIEESVRNLINTAFNKGSSDNITVILLEKGHLDRNKSIKINPKNISVKEMPGAPAARLYKKVSIVMSVVIIVILCAMLTNIFLKHDNYIPIKEKILKPDHNNKRYALKAGDDIRQDTSQYRIKENSKPLKEPAESTNVSSSVSEIKKMLIKEERIVVPDLVGTSVDTAKKTLEKMGLHYEINTVQGLREKIGIVLLQLPKGGESVQNNSKITMTIGN